MAPTAAYPTVMLTRDQADALASWLWEFLRDFNPPEDLDALRLTRASVRVFDAVEWQDEQRHESYDVPIHPEVAWLATEVLCDLVEDFAKPELAHLLASQGLDNHAMVGKVRLTLDSETRAWLLDRDRQEIEDHQHFITAANELIGGAMDAELAAA